MQIDALIFDLDETLLDTSSLRAARDAGSWGEVGRRLDEVQAYAVLGSAAEVLEIPRRAIAAGLRVGILTQSPRHYAEALLERFHIPYEALITGSDGYPAKPDPEGLREVMRRLGMSADRCAYVGDLDTDAAAAARAGALSVGVCWSGSAPPSWRRWWPDIAVGDPDLLLRLNEGEKLFLLGEAALDGTAVEWHWGTVAPVEAGVWACGRYLAVGDSRHHQSPLSQLILRAKDDPAAAVEVAAIFGKIADDADWLACCDKVVSVPPKPGAGYDRFAAIRADLAPRLNAVDGVGALEMAFDVPDYKQLGHDERRARNIGRFTAHDVAGERLLLIDDVITSGGQAEACRDAVLAAGATEVRILGLGLTQQALPEACPTCGLGTLRARRRRSDGRPFYGCSRYPACSFIRDAG